MFSAKNSRKSIARESGQGNRLQEISVESLSPSEALEELMDTPKKHSMLHRICRATNPITASGKKLQLTRMLGIAVIPILILLALTGRMFSEGVLDSLEASKVRRTLRFSTELAEMLYSLQNERDMSALYVSDLGKDVPKEFLVENYPVTDSSINRLSYWPAIEGNSHYSSKETFYNYLNRHRYELDTQQPTIIEELEFYSEAIEVFINWLYSALTEAQSGTVWKDLVALVETVEGLTSAGIERAVGSLFYINGAFPSRYTYLLFRKAQDVGNYSITHAKDYSQVAKRVYQNTIQNEKMFFQEISMKRDFIKATTLEQTDVYTNLISEDRALNGSLSEAQEWFRNMTSYLDAILEIQRSLISIINDDLEAQASEDRKILFIVAGLFFTVVILSPIILKSVYVLTKDFHNYSIILAERSKALEVEKKRTEKIFYQMLPKMLADKMRSKQVVLPEKYTNVTICFTNLVAIGSVRNSETPKQIINTINLMCSNYDRIIQKYDCCKIETVGSAYMVVSGLPQRNGDQHVVDIARMTLEFMDEMQNLTVPATFSEAYFIRIGIHSGPCIAGVIEYNMPRYWIFGDTVTIARRMEITSKYTAMELSKILPAITTLTICSFKELTLVFSQPTYWLFYQGDYIEGSNESLYSMSDHEEATLSDSKSSYHDKGMEEDDEDECRNLVAMRRPSNMMSDSTAANQIMHTSPFSIIEVVENGTTVHTDIPHADLDNTEDVLPDSDADVDIKIQKDPALDVVEKNICLPYI